MTEPIASTLGWMRRGWEASAFDVRRLLMAAYGLLGMLLLGALWVPQAHAANIIGFADNANSCGGAVLCSFDGTLGYTGTHPFDLSTINSWFQIDADGISHIAGQPVEPNGGAGDFLVVNDTGKVVTSFSLTITDTFTSSTPSVGPCSGAQSGNPVGCDNFQIHGGAANYFTTFTLTGPGCDTGCGTASADFAPGQVTYNWSGGTGVPIGATFDINFASWNNAVFTSTTVPEPASLLLFGTGLVGLGGWRRRRRPIQ